MRNLYLTVLSLIIVSIAHAQNYDFTATTGTYTAITGGTSPTLSQSDVQYAAPDEGFANNIPIGFTFTYNGTTYTTIHANTNGFASFGAFTVVDDNAGFAYYVNTVSGTNAGAVTSARPVLAPLWDDHDLAAASNLKYITTGSAPNRVFTLEWGNVLWDLSATAPVLSFQIKLYETTNVIEFIYRQEGGAVSNTSSGASIGISLAATGSNNFMSLSGSGASPTISRTTETRNIGTAPATNQVYRFTPQTLPVTITSFKGERQNNINKIDWTTATESNNNGFELQRSTDGINFSALAFITSKANNGNSNSTLNYSFGDMKPFKGTNYYRLKQVDRDGKFTLSGLVTIKGAKVSDFVLSAIYPNPVKKELNLVITAPVNDKVMLVVTDLNGKMILSQARQLLAGDNNIQMQVADLSKGTYIVKAICSNGCETSLQKFVKQ